MRKFAYVLFALTIAAVSAFAQKPNYGLPDLHTIKTITLSPSYSCRTPEEFQKGYEQTALFLSSYAKQRNSPDLVFNGACKSDDEFEASTAGDDFSLIADLGVDVPLEEVTASRAFNLRKIHSDSNYSKFSTYVKVLPNHTYAVLLNESDKRGLFIFQVMAHVPNKSVELRYAVKSYQIMLAPNFIRSDGFDWTRTNSQL
jgi:hypothetical protein